MAKQPPHPHDDEIAREVDELLKKLPAAELEEEAESAAGDSGASPDDVEPDVEEPDQSFEGRYPRAMAWGRVGLAVVLAGLMSQWPYTAACDHPLFVYLGAVGVVLIAGVWSGIWAWRRRIAVAHVLALGVIAYGGVLAAATVLPRVGYAKATAAWSCASVETAPALTPQRRPTDVGYAPLGPDSVYYASTGTGPPVLLVGGTSLDHRQWDELAFQLGSGYRVIRYDAPGSGRSPSPSVPVTPIEVLDAVYREFRLARARIVGHAAGGTLALDYANRYPDRVEALALMSARPTGYRAFTPFDQNRAQVTQIARRDGVVGVAEFFLSDAYYLPEARLRRPMRERIDVLLRQNAKVWTVTPDTSAAPEPDVDLSGITVPVLVIIPELDYPDLVALADTIVAGIPGAERVSVAQRGHMLQVSEPERLGQFLFDFFARD